MKRILFDLNDIKENIAHIGGKAKGLAESLRLIDELKQFGIPVDVPETFVLSDKAHEKYLKNGKVPNEVLVEAVKAMHAAGGKVAVRSSADIEDGTNKSYSGAFETVLNVSTVDQMREALERVYQSADNVSLCDGEKPKMSVLIQRMIEKPDYAGVVYSEDFDGDPVAVINYVQGKTAENLLRGAEKGKCYKIGKCVKKDSKEPEEYGDFSLFMPEDYQRIQNRELIFSRKIKFKSEKGEFAYGWFYPLLDRRLDTVMISLTAMVNKLEKDLGHPIDMEFAASKDKIYLLQQRPYLSQQNFIIKTLENGDVVGYFKDQPVITTVMTDKFSPVYEEKYSDYLKNSSDSFCDFSGYAFVFEHEKKFYREVDGKLVHKRNRVKPYQYAQRALWYGKAKADVVVDNGMALNELLYGHYGNEIREMGQPFWISLKGDALKGVKAGEKVRIDLSKGTFEKVFSNEINLQRANSR